MDQEKLIRLGQASRKLNIGHNAIIDFLSKKGFSIENNPNAKLTPEQFAILAKEFASSAWQKAAASGLTIGVKHIEPTPVKTDSEVIREKTEDEPSILLKNLDSKETVKLKEETKSEKVEKKELEKPTLEGFKVLGKINLEKNSKIPEANLKITKEESSEEHYINPSEAELIKAKADKLKGLKVVERIELPTSSKISQGFQNTKYIDSTLTIKNGQVVSSTIRQIISPSQIITEFSDGILGRLSILNLSWCMPEAFDIFKNLVVGQTIECYVLNQDEKTKQVQLSLKHLSQPISNSIKWQRIERGDEFRGVIKEILNDSAIVDTENGLFGLLHKKHLNDITADFKFKVNFKNDSCNLLSLVPATFKIEKVENTLNNPSQKFDLIEDELKSYGSFKVSLLGRSASDEEHEIIKMGYEADAKLFSREISHKNKLYIQFDLNSPAYEIDFKRNAIPYFLNKVGFTPDDETSVLNSLSSLTYWIRINERPDQYSSNQPIIEFSLYNEEVGFFGDILVSNDKRDYKLAIRQLSVGQIDNLNKKRNTRDGSFLLASSIKVLTPFMSLPIGNRHQEFVEKIILKNKCFQLVQKLKIDSGELLKQEGKTFIIMDKFLEYQMALIDEQKGGGVFINSFEQIPNTTGGVTIRVPRNIIDSLEIDEETIVEIQLKKTSTRLSQGQELGKLVEGALTYNDNSCTIDIKQDINLDLLREGFYIDKRISKSQLKIQREIIQDFLGKKIKIDHIEAILVNPERTKTPTISNVNYYNHDLANTESEQSDNNQIQAVKKAIGNQDIFLIQGPPGTGKTTVITEIIQHLVARGERILVAGQNHVAVDNVLEKLSQLTNINLLRVGNPEKINKELIRYSINHLVDDYRVDYSKFLNNQLLLCTSYRNLVQAGLSKDEIILNSTNIINECSNQYSKLRSLFRERHLNLRGSLFELNDHAIEMAIESLSKWIESSQNEHEILLKPLIYGTIDVVFATCIGIKSDPVIKDSAFKFDTVIIDEAGKANIAETLVAIELGEKVILVGDQKQLPPYIDSSLIDENDPKSFPNSMYGREFKKEEILHALKASFFEFITNRIKADKFPKANLEMLNYQHRMHPNIGQFVSETFYDGQIRMGKRTHFNRIELPAPFDREVIFFDTSNTQNPYEQSEGFSVRNKTEAEIISEVILPKLFEHKISLKSIAIITPYKSQVANIQYHIRISENCYHKDIDVSTLDSFQGMEYDVIIFSFTRSAIGKRVGFLDDARRLNVAFSRARKKLILVGNSVTLTDARSHYDGLFNYTKLFENLVAISKRDDIGRFVNDVKIVYPTTRQIQEATIESPNQLFQNFTNRYKEGDIVDGKVRKITKRYGTEIVTGLQISVDNFNCFFPISLMTPQFRDSLNTVKSGDPIQILIYEIDSTNNKVIVKLPKVKGNDKKDKRLAVKANWEDLTSKLKLKELVSVRIITRVNFGYFVELDNGIEALLHNNDIHVKTPLELNQTIKVSIKQIDNIKKRISVIYHNGTL